MLLRKYFLSSFPSLLTKKPLMKGKIKINVPISQIASRYLRNGKLNEVRSEISPFGTPKNSMYNFKYVSKEKILLKLKVPKVIPKFVPLNIPFRKGQNGLPSKMKFLMNHIDEISKGKKTMTESFLKLSFLFGYDL